MKKNLVILQETWLFNEFKKPFISICKHVDHIFKISFLELYLTMRGYSFASAWIEKFKQSTKKTKRSKSLRRDLYENL